MSRQSNVPTIYSLARGELFSLRLRAGQCRIRCLEGRAWVTRSGMREDSVLGPGEEVVLAAAGTVVLEALTGSTVRLEATAAVRVRGRAFPLLRLPVRTA